MEGFDNRTKSIVDKERQAIQTPSRTVDGLGPVIFDDEKSIREFWGIIWKGRWKIVISTFCVIGLGVIYAISLPNLYKSEALLISNMDEKSGAASLLAGQFGGLASLAGIDLGGGSSDKTALALEVLKSRDFLYRFITDNNLKLDIMAANGWSREQNAMLYDSDIYNDVEDKWVREVSIPFAEEPSINEAYEQFVNENLVISFEKDSGMVKLSIVHYSPEWAKSVVDKLIVAINTEIKTQDMREANESISYLEKEISQTDVSQMTAMFYQLIEKQQQKLMLTKIRDDYVLKIIDPPVIAEEKFKPSRILVVIIFAILGILFSTLYVVLAGFIKENLNDR